MALYLVRHAKAGKRSDWAGEDEERPLSRNGELQATALAARLADRATGPLLASPYLRCRQTLAPLAARIGRAVEVAEPLREGSDLLAVVDLLEAVPDGSVLCSHGDVIPAAIEALVRRGIEVRSQPDWRKATVWVIERTPEGAWARARVWPPPEI